MVPTLAKAETNIPRFSHAGRVAIISAVANTVIIKLSLVAAKLGSVKKIASVAASAAASATKEPHQFGITYSRLINTNASIEPTPSSHIRVGVK